MTISLDVAGLTDDMRSLAWSPQPPWESDGGHDCRPGGDCGLDFDRESRRAKWIQARFRFLREQRSSHVPGLR